MIAVGSLGESVSVGQWVGERNGIVLVWNLTSKRGATGELGEQALHREAESPESPVEGGHPAIKLL